jgi:hypothetical protein
VLAKVDGRQVLEQVPRRLRAQDLSPVCNRGDACRAVHVEPDVALAGDRRLPGVQPHPHAEVGAVRPGAGEERALAGDCGRRRVRRAREGDEERIALGGT